MRNFRNFTEKRYRLIVTIYFLLFLFIGLSIFADYGISWDELYRREAGYRVLNFFTSGNLYTQMTKIYELPQYQVVLLKETGNVFVVFLALLEKLFSFIEDIRNIFFLRHLVSFLFFFLSVFLFYKTLKLIFNNWKIGLLGCTFLIFSPRIFADSFYNPKDIPFLSMFIIAIYTLLVYLRNKSILNSIFLLLSSAILISINYVGMILPLFTIAFFITDYLLIHKLERKRNLILSSFIVYIIILPFLILFFWPTLLPGPFQTLIENFKFMINIPWGGILLYFGNYIGGTNLPWHYLPVWILITTPIVYSLFFIVGLIFSIKTFIKNPKSFYKNNKEILISLLLFFIPFLSVIILNPTIYNGWRHLFFIYPSFLVISIFGIFRIYKIQINRNKIFKYIKISIISIISIQLVLLSLFMIKNHPHQNVYFNFFAGKNLRERFELDYWGLSYKQALEYIVENDNSEIINIKVIYYPGVYNQYILKPDERKRIKFVEDIKSADYFINNSSYNFDYPDQDEIYSIIIDNNRIIAVYSLK